MTHLFSKQNDDMLIEMVRVNPILYDPYHDNFRNLIMKHQIWENISNTIGIPLTEVKKRWRHFRDHYLKKLKMHEAGLIRGKPWEHMHRLEFLALCRPRRLPGAHEQVVFVVPPGAAACSPQHSADSDDEPVTGQAEPCYKRKYSSEHSTEIEEPQSSTACEDRRELQRILLPELEKSPVHKFFESMADIVEQFPPRIAAQARLQVCQLVTEMELQVHSEQMQWQESTLRPVKRE